MSKISETTTFEQIGSRARQPLGLSKPQQSALEYAHYNDLGNNLYCEVDDATTVATLNALSKKGYLRQCKQWKTRYWLTDRGAQIHERLRRNTQGHKAIEDLCFVVSEALEWFTADQGEDCSIIANGFEVPDWVYEARRSLDENRHLTK